MDKKVHLNGTLKWILRLLGGLTLIFAGVLGTTFINSFAKASDAISRAEVQSMIDKDIANVNANFDHVNENIGLLREDIKDLKKLITGGGT